MYMSKIMGVGCYVFTHQSVREKLLPSLNVGLGPGRARRPGAVAIGAIGTDVDKQKDQGVK
jgi:hypothetical protein